MHCIKELSHRVIEKQYGVTGLDQHGKQTHYMNQRLLMANWTLIEENAENIVSKIRPGSLAMVIEMCIDLTSSYENVFRPNPLILAP